jgi:hypothetical protein
MLKLTTTPPRLTRANTVEAALAAIKAHDSGYLTIPRRSLVGIEVFADGITIPAYGKSTLFTFDAAAAASFSREYLTAPARLDFSLRSPDF